MLDQELTGDDGRPGAMAIFEEFEEIAPMIISERRIGDVAVFLTLRWEPWATCSPVLVLTTRSSRPVVRRRGRRGAARSG